MKRIVFSLFLLFALGAQAQKWKKEDRKVLSNLENHIKFLADDRLEGRRTGTQGEKLAAEYIAARFKSIGLQTAGTEGYFQPFEIQEGKEINPDTKLKFNDSQLTLGEDFFPMVYSPNISLKSTPTLALHEPGMPWFYDLKEILQENAANPHFDLDTEIKNSAKLVHKRGGNAVFIYNSTGKPDGLKFNSRDHAEVLPIPVIYLTPETATKYLNDPTASIDIDLNLNISPKKRKGTNVAGMINNGADHTVIIGAHFDHLGYGEDHNSRETTRAIHNGADDNASGTAAMMELARLLKNYGSKKSNYLFLAFSGEELGLYGSKYFTQHPSVELARVNYMINLDMVGRLNDSSRMVTVGGFGTSPSWSELFQRSGKKALYAKDLSFRFDSSGTGPSDHTSFYLKDIPVLFYFTGLHTDYHKSTDDAEKINYRGALNIVRHIYDLVNTQTSAGQKLVFTKTREAQTQTSARFSVSLGIMPDYTFSGPGVRADGVSENRPAKKAGISAGDVILSIGDYKTGSMEAYMQALSKFKKGDKTTVTYQRGNQTLSTTVEF